MTYAIGQRWLSHADSELGLGIIVENESRRVTVHFPAVEEERTYATENAPLTRVRFREGETLTTRDGRRRLIAAVHEEQGLLIYESIDGDQRELIAELDLDDHIDLDSPRQRLVTSQVDSHASFSLRLETAHQIDRLQRSGLRGLLGTRTSLLPHQLYIANEVGKRHAPRVLLADEVGLGKTIEAGMILHRQLLSGESSRVLIIVPDSLQFQWLVEMRRRFNLSFAIFDEERLHNSATGSAFEDEQLVLCAVSLFRDPLVAELALSAPWDIAVVDEVHRLSDNPDAPGEEFAFLRRLAAQVPGLLLLTATPEQVGQRAHFERLALLDPERFHDFDAFVREESQYRRWSDLLDALDRGETPDDLPEDIDRQLSAGAQASALIDRYGTGRVLFRNSRVAVGGFPERVMTTYPLAIPENLSGDYRVLYPDKHMDRDLWLAEDPRVGWLEQHLKQLRPEKVLVICAEADTALALESYLQLRAGIRSAAFHEHLSLVERDRAAAYFAEQDQGAQALICSEIGGEGRNFQFAQHLVLFDLPAHPDQLEQRIGRLDRIGQRDRIFIHVPYLQGSAQERLMRWYHEGMDLFRASCSAGDMILAKYRDELEKHLEAYDESTFASLISATADFTGQTREELSAGRDRLLERSSCDPDEGAALSSAIESVEDPELLFGYLERLCNVAGVEHDEHGTYSAVLRPAEQEALAVFPELPEDGCTVTVSRERALEREDFIFLGWEHPWMESAMETLIGSSLGQAAVGAMSLRGVPAGSRLYELLFTVSLSAPRFLGVHRYLPLSPKRILIDAKGRDLSELLSHDKLNTRIEKLPRGTVTKIVRQLRNEIETVIENAEHEFAHSVEALKQSAINDFSAQMDLEIDRLEGLQRVNPAIRPSEIEQLHREREAGVAALQEARGSLQAARLVLTR